MEINKVYNMDCIEGMKRIPDKSIDMVLCDLPYGTTKCKWDVIIPFTELWKQYNRITKDNAAIVLTAVQPFTSFLINSNIKCFKYCWIWNKPQGIDPFMAKKRPLNDYEDICVFANKKVPYIPQMQKGQPYRRERDKKERFIEITGIFTKPTVTENIGERYPKRILEYAQERGLHPTQKPVPLLEYLIKTYTNETDIVLDNCFGSGSTLVAAANTNRRYIGFELEQKYFDIACQRLAETTKILAK